MKNSSVRGLKILVALVILTTMYSCSNLNHPGPYLHLGQGTILDHDIDEASGLIVSSRNPGLLWTMNDSGNTPMLYGVSERGRKLATLTIAGAENLDWEDLSQFEQHGQSYLVIGDIGDNGEDRKSYTVYIVKEPELQPVGMTPVARTLIPVRTFSFMYEDGPHDCESLAVDVAHQQILLLTKRTQVPVLYSLPLDGSQHIARRLGAIRPFPQPSHHYYRLLDLLNLTDWPTSMDISPDGRALAVLTYGTAYYYRRDADESWLTALRHQPQEIVVPELQQPESIAFTADSQSVWVTTETLPAPLLRLSIPAKAQVSGDHYSLNGKK